MTISTHWNRSSAMTSIALAAIIAAGAFGAVVGNFFDPPKAFFLFVVAMIVWLTAGWFFGGLRSVLVGLIALAGALMISGGAFAPAIIFLVIAALVLMADVTPRAQNRHSA